MQIDIITIFPGYFGALRMSLIGKAAERGDISINVHDLRAWSHDVHRSVDDTPYGGGPGMVMTPGPWGEAIDTLAPPGVKPAPRLVVPTPSGALFTQRTAACYAREPHLVFACGRYEGIDARVIDEARTRMPVDEVSIGDYVLAGGEAAALVIVEATCRLLPGVVGNAASVTDDSFGGHGGHRDQGGRGGAGRGFPVAGGARPSGQAGLSGRAGQLGPTGPGGRAESSGQAGLSGQAGPVGHTGPGGQAGPSEQAGPSGQERHVRQRGHGPFGGAGGEPGEPGGAGSVGGMAGLLEGPVYTKPRVWRGREIPTVLVSGNHAAIARWRRDAALRRTAAMRPELVRLLDPASLDFRDRQVLSEAGFPVRAEDVAH